MDEATALKIKKSFIAQYGEKEGLNYFYRWASKRFKAEADTKTPKPKKKRLARLLFSD